MAPNAYESDMENFREEEDEDLKVFHKTKKASKNAMVSLNLTIYHNNMVIVYFYRISQMLETDFLLLQRTQSLRPQKTLCPLMP